MKGPRSPSGLEHLSLDDSLLRPGDVQGSNLNDHFFFLSLIYLIGSTLVFGCRGGDHGSSTGWDHGSSTGWGENINITSNGHQSSSNYW